MSAIYSAIPTNAGKAKIANSIALGVPIKITHMAVGDGNGKPVTPDPAQSALVREQRRAPLNTLFQDPLNPAQLVAEQIIPENVGGWWIREVGLYDETGTLIAIANSPDTYKPQLSEGSGRTQTIRMVLIVSDTSAVELKIDPSVVQASRKYVDDVMKAHKESRDHPDASETEKGFSRHATQTEVNENKSTTPGAQPVVTVDTLWGWAEQAGGKVPSVLSLWKRSLAEAGYELVGQFGSANTIETPEQALLSNDGTAVYAWSGEFPKDVDENETPENSGGIVPGAWLDKTDDVLRNQLETTNGASMVKTKAGQSIQQILDYTYYFNALEPNPNGVADNAALFVKADTEAMGRAIFISGNGVYFSTYTPLSPLLTNGTASIKIGVKEYRISSIPQKLSQLEQVEVDGEVVRMSNLCAGQDSAPHMVDSPESYANTLYGTSSGRKIRDNVKRLTGFGGSIARDLKKGYSLDLFGTNSAQWTNFADRLTLVGANSGKNIGSENPVGRHAYFNPLDPDPNGWDTRWPEWRQFAGAVDAPAQVMTEADFGLKATHVVGIGRNTFGFSITTKDSVGAGYDTCTSLLYGQDVVGIGDRVMQWTIKGDFCTWGGSKAARSVMESYQDTGWGCLAGANYVRMRRNTISGYQVMAGFLCNLTDIPESNCFYGRISAANAKGSIKWNCGFGENTLTYVQSNGNTCNGQNALSKLSDPLKGNNTASGMDSMVSMQDLTPCTSVENSSGFGYQARVSGDNQVQLGNSATTTYVFGTVQNRSDARDKTDVVNTKLGINFIMGLRPVDGRWDMRDDYVEAYQAQIGIDDEAEPIFETRYRKLPKDGSKARQRLHHWFIAQEVKELCDELGVEFGGYQDHKVLGGSDVLTLGYDEFIPPITKAVQDCWTRMNEVENRLSLLEKGK